MNIRRVIDSDIDNGLLDVYIEGYNYHVNGRPDIFMKLTDEQMKKDLLDIINYFPTLVIEDNNKIVGYLAYKIKERHTKKLDVDQLVILEHYRGQGLGKKLMEEVKRIAIEENCDRIELNCWMFNEKALGMYEHIGFDKQRIMYEMKLK